jgi:hypothetical protein
MDWLPASLTISSVFQSSADSFMAAVTCSTVTIVVGDRNQPLPWMPITSDR